MRISCAGYPSRKPIELFLTRFGLLAPDEAAKFFTPVKSEGFRRYFERCQFKEWQIGKTKVFLRSWANGCFGYLAIEKLGWAAVEIQKHVSDDVSAKAIQTNEIWRETVNRYTRGMFARKIAREIRQTKAVTTIQAFVRMAIAENSLRRRKRRR